MQERRKIRAITRELSPAIERCELTHLAREPIDYLRAVSTGPVTPLVLSVTTTGERVNVALSYRSTVFSDAEIGQVQRRLVGGVASLATLA